MKCPINRIVYGAFFQEGLLRQPLFYGRTFQRDTFSAYINRCDPGCRNTSYIWGNLFDWHETSIALIFLQRNLQYPAHARRMGLQGTVVLNMTITKEGKIEDIVVADGIDIVMDKEAARVIRLLQLATPPMLKGQPIDVCASVPIKYKLAN